MKLRNAFSLLEISIVLIIVGLLSIVTFRSAAILDNSKLKRIYNEYQNQKAAFHSFKVIYNIKAGDITTAYDIWGDDCNSDRDKCNGNGDGVLNVNEGSDQDETYMSLKHLYLAELLASNYSGENSSGQIPVQNIITSFWASNIAYMPPSNSDGSIFNYSKFNNQTVISIGRISDDTPVKYTYPFLTPKQAALFDNKYDDSLPWFGDIRAYIRPVSDYESTPSQTNCISGITGISSEIYKLSEKRKVCSLIFLLE